MKSRKGPFAGHGTKPAGTSENAASRTTGAPRPSPARNSATCSRVPGKGGGHLHRQRCWSRKYRRPPPRDAVFFALPLQHDAIDRHLLARPHAQRIADMYMCGRHVLFGAIRVDPSGRPGREAEQGLDRRRALRTRLEFEQLPEQGQRNDHRCGLEVHRHPTHRDERRRKHDRGHGSDDAVDERCRRAQADQPPHVRAAVDHGLHGALKGGRRARSATGGPDWLLSIAMKAQDRPLHECAGVTI